MQFIDLKTQQERIKPQLDAAIQRVLGHGRYIMGPEIEDLEEKLAEFVGAKHCIACGSGTDALLLPLLAYEVGPGDAVFTTPFTFFATPETIALTGATPVFVDIDPATYNMDAGKLQAAIEEVESSSNLKPRGVMPIDLFGLPADYDAILPLAREHDLFVIEDGCQALGADCKGKKVPAFGDVGATSFFPAKPLGCYGDGGAAFTDDDNLADILRSLRVHGQGEDKYNNVRIGLNARMDTIQAAILLEKLKIYPEEIGMRQDVANHYLQKLATLGANSPISKMPGIPENCQSVFAQFCLESEQREEIQSALKEAEIPSPIYYAKPMHKLDAMRGSCYPQSGIFPASEAAAEKIFALPFHPYLTAEEIDYIVEVIASVAD